MIAVQVCPCRNFGSVKAGVRFGHTKTRLVLPLDQWRQHPTFLGIGAMDHHRIKAENVDMDGARATHGGAQLRDSLSQNGGLSDPEAGPPVGLGHCDSKPMTGRHRIKESMRERRGVFTLKPVSVVEPCAQTQDLLADLLLRVSQCEIHLRPLLG